MSSTEPQLWQRLVSSGRVGGRVGRATNREDELMLQRAAAVAAPGQEAWRGRDLTGLDSIASEESGVHLLLAGSHGFWRDRERGQAQRRGAGETFQSQQRLLSPVLELSVQQVLVFVSRIKLRFALSLLTLEEVSLHLVHLEFHLQRGDEGRSGGAERRRESPAHLRLIV
jgi:hypothetical protein